MVNIPATQRLFSKITGGNPSHFSGDRRPIESISWGEAVLFCSVFNEKAEKELLKLQEPDSL